MTTSPQQPQGEQTRLLEQVRPLDPGQLDEIEARLNISVQEWANKSPVIEAADPLRLIQKMAKLDVAAKVLTARRHLVSFRNAVDAGRSLERLRHMGDSTPAEHVGMASGHLAVARTVATWYGVGSADIANVLTHNPDDITPIAGSPGETAVFTMPTKMKMVKLNPLDIYAQEKWRTHAVAVGLEQGADVHAALAPYLEFPQYPNWQAA